MKDQNWFIEIGDWFLEHPVAFLAFFAMVFSVSWAIGTRVTVIIKKFIEK